MKATLCLFFVFLCTGAAFAQTTGEAVQIIAQSAGSHYNANLSYAWGNGQIKDAAGTRSISFDATKSYRSDSVGICFRSTPFTIHAETFIAFDSRLHFTLSTETPERYIGDPIPTIITVDLIDAATGKKLDRIDGISIRSGYGDQMDTIAAGHLSMECREMIEGGQEERNVYLQATIITNNDALGDCKGNLLPAGADVMKADLQ